MNLTYYLIKKYVVGLFLSSTGVYVIWKFYVYYLSVR